ncbi:DNA ligase (NAD(+)) LigA [Nibricoccus aquaticus]|uniref:DNA ligase n=1 Tax=Nibricoccus aquaticus TaxID=2576891 RepID=A0A290Q356_9BACT|nr:NAD-dependent DNA ligase LigA [Nibricoccus aquaticus]ATC63109.1 DNA ligase (NAD(+)) LigA [Nibricoccus aquaticus]
MAKFLGGSRAGRVASLAVWFLIAWLRGAAVEGVADNAVERMNALRGEIARHDELYFKKAAPEISDEAYDRLKRELVELERRAGVKAGSDEAGGAIKTAAVGDDRSGRFPTWRHGERMMSLEKVYSEAELRVFLKRVEAEARGGTAMNDGAKAGEVGWVVEPKYDGLAVSATYERGRLVRLVTRGDGSEGDNVTANARGIAGLAERLAGAEWPDRIEVRGEVLVTFAEFARVNAERAALGEAEFANPRALAAGSLKLDDAAEAARRGLSVVFYGFGEVRPVSARAVTQGDFYARVRAWGLPGIAEVRRAKTVDDVCAAVRAFERRRSELAFPTDGVVIKLDEVAQQERIGATGHAPRWAVAYKFTTERACTWVKAITVQVGRSGVLTPVAELEPVRLGGARVARATLHNAEEIARMDVRVGDMVFVEKAGEIIPAVVGVDKAGRGAERVGGRVAVAFLFPEDCPVCGAGVVTRTEDGAMRYCPNRDCEAQVVARLKHFAGTQGVAIRGLGEETIAAAVRSGCVRTLGDFYRMTREEWRAVPGVGEKTAGKLFAAVEASRRAELWRVISGLGVPGVGAATARVLGREFGTLEELAAAGVERLARVNGVSARQAEALVAFFAEKETRALMEAMRASASGRTQ